ncbi:ROK family protein [Kribbella italica]|uniref:Glucokinase n=1 Tax=Kribbella italica TaxID=1540520 RepID=A0A7W9J104_9ACTN|nr:glucokinase [Kribbella italica]
MSPDAAVAGVDIGGTKLVAALISADATIVVRATATTPASNGPSAVLAAVTALVRQVSAGQDLAAVGVGTAGVVDPDRGVIVGATNAIDGWAGTNLGEELRAHLGVPVRAVNDVSAFASAEHHYGAARGARDVIAVMVGTGVGGALIVNGAPVHGRNAAAGHLGHLEAAAASGRACPCGRDGHLEAVASGPAMTAEFARRSGEEVRDLREVVRRADSGDLVARQVLAQGAAALGATLGGLVNTLDPDVIVLGGGVLDSGDVFSRPLADALSGTLIPAVGAPCLRQSQLGADAVVIGAAAIARETLS